ncbi:MAG: hypothetical protein ACJA2G_001775 [Cognaticolwellia sp.]|jgi:hypothetical protein
MLALEDTSTLSYRHNVIKELGFTGASKKCKAKGMLAHSVLMGDADTEHTIGLAEQYRWCRKDEDFDTKHQRKWRICFLTSFYFLYVNRFNNLPWRL